jgi:hypothetical protein
MLSEATTPPKCRLNVQEDSPVWDSSMAKDSPSPLYIAARASSSSNCRVRASSAIVCRPSLRVHNTWPVCEGSKLATKKELVRRQLLVVRLAPLFNQQSASRRMLPLILSAPTLLSGCSAATNEPRTVAGIRVSRRSLCFSTLLALPAATLPAAAADSPFKGLDPNWKPSGVAGWRSKGDSAAVEAPKDFDGIGDPGFFQPTGDLLYIQNARRELDALGTKLGAPGYKLNEEDRIAIFQLLGFSFKPTRVLMEKMLEPKPSAPLAALRATDRVKGAELTSQFGQQLTALEDRNRRRVPGAEQAEAARAASELLADFLKVAAAKYKVPELVVQPGAAPVI